MIAHELMVQFNHLQIKWFDYILNVIKNDMIIEYKKIIQKNDSKNEILILLI